MGPEATVEYYNLIIDAFKKDNSDLNYPEIIIYSVNLSEFIKLMNEKKYDQAATLLLEKIDNLKKAGADFAALTANTPHMLFDDLKKKSPLTLISIVEATLNVCIQKGLKRPGLIGTGFTMNATFYADVFSRKGLEVFVPDTKDRKEINYKLFTEIELGIFKDETRNMLIDKIEKLARQHRIDSIILGCTEFPLILTEPIYAGIPALNTTGIHVKEIVDYCMGG